jgi:hypothetical protein
MKKIHLLLLGLTICLFSACHNELWEAIDGLDSRVTKLEELCKEMNTNITSLQTIVDVLQSNDFITGVVEIKKDGEVIGYTITFGKHDPITIYHGQDGKDGADGKDGQDGQNGSVNAPVIGVAQDSDGVYYWTLNGEWLLDDYGNKLPVSGKDGQNGTNGSNGQDGADGKDGQNGEDGKDGADGQDGKDGITPQLKIEDGYWYISYDNGATWTQLGKATGEDGKDGQNGSNGTNAKDGKDGQDGDSMFQSVTQDEKYVYFTLADGTVIKIAKSSGSNDQPNSEFIFTITYDPNGGDGEMPLDTFYYGISQSLKYSTFVKKGYHCILWNTKADGTGVPYKQGMELTIDKDITLYAQWDFADFSVSDSTQVTFAPGNLQYQSSSQTWRFARTQYESFMTQSHSGWVDQFCWSSNLNPGGVTEPTSGDYTFFDWGNFQVGNEDTNTWRTLTIDEWEYLISKRNSASNLWFYAWIEEVLGVVFLPDNWVKPITSVVFSDALNWNLLEDAGAVFIPKNKDSYNSPDLFYWSSSQEGNTSYYLEMKRSSDWIYYGKVSISSIGGKITAGVRLVKNIE